MKNHGVHISTREQLISGVWPQSLMLLKYKCCLLRTEKKRRHALQITSNPTSVFLHQTFLRKCSRTATNSDIVRFNVNLASVSQTLLTTTTKSDIWTESSSSSPSNDCHPCSGPETLPKNPGVTWSDLWCH